MKVTVLGCGSSLGVPSLKYGWGHCDERNHKNRRTRSSIIIESGNTSLLVDMSPDLRQQILDYGSQKIDAVIMTHIHFDHTFGINELRPLFHDENKILPIYARKNVLKEIDKVFWYFFKDSKHELYRPHICTRILEDNFRIGDISGICFEQDHGFSKSTGIRIGNFAYSTDVVSMDRKIFEKLMGLDVWIVECTSLRDVTPTHASLDLALQWIDEVKPRRAFLTHMGATMDYDNLLKILPKNVEPAYDQMSISI
ncbi:MAG: MBL fold metallo-hydrolase [Holosporaceae bacterium]|jgi:phosphoribosyl 1,2-cyclic phosphate phosphodiesterase|nr:MBL fold metallo-hydrolase [Holosporaceae bacterium]